MSDMISAVWRTKFLGVVTVIWATVLVLVAQPPQGPVSTTGGSATPGSAFTIPVTLALEDGVTIDSLAFALQIIPNGNAPALQTPPNFIQDSALPAATFQGIAAGNDVISVSWVSGLAVSMTSQLGTVGVTVPRQAVNGQTYTIKITRASATSRGTTGVTIPREATSDQPRTIRITGASGTSRSTTHVNLMDEANSTLVVSAKKVVRGQITSQ